MAQELIMSEFEKMMQEQYGIIVHPSKEPEEYLQRKPLIDDSGRDYAMEAHIAEFEAKYGECVVISGDDEIKDFFSGKTVDNMLTTETKSDLPEWKQESEIEYPSFDGDDYFSKKDENEDFA